MKWEHFSKILNSVETYPSSKSFIQKIHIVNNTRKTTISSFKVSVDTLNIVV